MNESNFGFYFEKAGRSASQGAVSPAEQFFEGSLAESSLVRETAQNSVDARAGLEPVTMVFELAEMETSLIPGIDDLRTHLEQVEVETRRTQGHESMATALRTARQEKIQVLRISDYGTTGLTGSESMHTPTSALSALTRGAGISADDGTRGGSFGIGSAVGPMASNMSTVLYTSLPSHGQDTVFAGYSCLASHRDAENVWRGGDGFYTDLNEEHDFHYLRNPDALGPFPLRTESGTDVFILGYRKADTDPDLQHIKVAFMRNFLMAIDRGGLIAKGVTPTHTWELNQASLEKHVREDAEAQAFYRAIKDPEPIWGTSKRLGKMALYINIDDDSLEKTLHTITLRRPLMRIDTFRHHSIPVKYAAVLECSDDDGNKLLRALEPPQHHKWDPGRDPHGESLLRELKNFVRDGLKSRVKQQIGDQVVIKGLARYLPTELFEEKSGTLRDSGTPQDGPGTYEESSTVQGSDGERTRVATRERQSVRVGVRTSAGSRGNSTRDRGKDQSGEAMRKQKGGSSPEGEPGDGPGRITAGDISFRSWSDASTGDLCMAITALEDVSGDLEIVPLGPGGSVEDDYTLPISEGLMTVKGTSVPLGYQGNVLSQLQLTAGITSHVRLKLSSRHRYRLGVK
ncbi:MAG: hypothetical protein ACQEXN_10190 [Actinomycetota bacterium]